MPRAGVDEHDEPLVVEREHALCTQFLRELRSAKPVLGIDALVEPLCVVEEREEQDELGVAALDLTRETEPRPGDGLPVLLPVVTRSGDASIGR